MYTKGSIRNSIKLITVNYCTRLREPFLISSITFIPYSNRLVSLLISDSGLSFYFPSLNSSQTLTFASSFCLQVAPLKPLLRGLYSFLYQLRPLVKISHLELTPHKGIQYVRSAGSYAKILNFNIAQHTSLVKLPSGVRKYFSLYSIVLPTASSLQVKSKLSNGKSGF
jgi:ribosomal protein L2